MQELKVFYGTFGGGQTPGLRSVKIDALSEEDARDCMFKTFGPKFCSVYGQDYEQEKEFFQPPIMGLTVKRVDEYESSPRVVISEMALDADTIDILSFVAESLNVINRDGMHPHLLRVTIDKLEDLLKRKMKL